MTNFEYIQSCIKKKLLIRKETLGNAILTERNGE